MEQTALQYLNHNPIFHMDMIEVIGRGSAQIIAANEKGVLLMDNISGAYMLTVSDQNTGIQFLDHVTKAELFVVHQEFCVKEVEKRYPLKRSMICYQGVWNSKERMDIPYEGLIFQALTEEDTEIVAEMYSHPIAHDYIRGRIQAKEMFGAFLADKLAGFIGLHEEGSMGMLEVSEEFRRKGIGISLVAYLSNYLLAQGRTPFSQIVKTNTGSYQMHEKMGFSISEDCLSWLE